MASTPMMRQWTAIKRAYPDCIVMFRLGDFYEAFNEDASRLAEICDVTLTSRPVSKGERVPMAGVPYHAVDGYIAQVVRHGVKVAIVEQTGAETSPEKRARMSRVPIGDETPSAGSRSPGGKDLSGAAKPPPRALMEREVVRVVTPGTLVEGDLLDARANNYLAAVVRREAAIGLAHADVTTGQFLTTQLGGGTAEGQLLDELVRLRPAELLYPERDDGAPVPLVESLAGALATLGLPTILMPYVGWRFDAENARRTLLDHFGAIGLEAYGCGDKPLAVSAAGAVLAYLQETQRGAVAQLTGLATYAPDDFMVLDAATRHNLELTATTRGERKGSLLWVLDETKTAMGARRLRSWIEQPLLDRARIEHRHDAVAALVERGQLRAELRAALKGMPDIERLVNRAVAGYAGPRELLALARGLGALPELVALLGAGHAEPGTGNAESDAGDRHLGADDGQPEVDDGQPRADGVLPPRLAGLCRQPVAAVADAISAAIADEPPAALGAAGVIRPGYSQELDGIHAAVADARAWIAGLEERERQRTGIRKLKVGYNKVFGYYLAVPKSQADNVPDDYHRKQTLVDSERYITPDLKERESEVLHAEERIVALERELFSALVATVAGAAETVLAAARDVGMLDALQSLAEVAVRHDYYRPRLDDGRELKVHAGRHPVVERMPLDRPFVPNDMQIGPGEIIILTGPNMAGKSTVGRQVALIVLMAQVGSFVPAEVAEIGIVDRIFTRIGAQDELAAGRSTFMVEMVETANIIHHATPRSLIVLDELGRGTSTYDGMAIAWAVIEHIHNNPRLGARTVFATHYHELTALADLLPRVRNYCMAVAETDEGVVFLHRVEPGAADRSYGIHVAQLAGLTRDVVARAWQVLERLEAEGNVPLQDARNRPPPAGRGQLPLFAPLAEEHPVVGLLRDLSVDTMSPLEALTQLYELQRQVRRGDEGED